MNRYFYFSKDVKGNYEYLDHNEKPTLTKGKEFESLAELWKEYPKVFGNYDIDYFQCKKKEILNIVNYNYYDTENPYLLDFNSAYNIKCCYLAEKTKYKTIYEYLTPQLRNSRVMVIFMNIYVKNIGIFYNEIMGGRSKHDNIDVDIYLDLLNSAYLHILEYLTYKGVFRYTTLDKVKSKRKIWTISSLWLKYPKYFPNGFQKYEKYSKKILEIINNKYTIRYCKYLIPYNDLDKIIKCNNKAAENKQYIDNIISKELFNSSSRLIEFLQIYYCNGLMRDLYYDGYGYYVGSPLEYLDDYKDKLLIAYEVVKSYLKKLRGH
jgi:hypothetical protein